MPKLPPALFGAGGGKKVGAEVRWVPCDLAWGRGELEVRATRTDWRQLPGAVRPRRIGVRGARRGAARQRQKNPRAVGCLLVVFKHERWSVKSQRPD